MTSKSVVPQGEPVALVDLDDNELFDSFNIEGTDADKCRSVIEAFKRKQL